MEHQEASELLVAWEHLVALVPPEVEVHQEVVVFQVVAEFLVVEEFQEPLVLLEAVE
jgi:hypothetical protein